MDVNVENGEGIINDVTLIAEHDDVAIYHVDLRPKYAQTMCGSSSNFLDVTFYPDDDTLRWPEGSPEASVVFNRPSSEWTVNVTGSRYSFTIFVYKFTGSELVWCSNPKNWE